jgi:hypothetical protein
MPRPGHSTAPQPPAPRHFRSRLATSRTRPVRPECPARWRSTCSDDLPGSRGCVQGSGGKPTDARTGPRSRLSTGLQRLPCLSWRWKGHRNSGERWDTRSPGPVDSSASFSFSGDDWRQALQGVKRLGSWGRISRDRHKGPRHLAGIPETIRFDGLSPYTANHAECSLLLARRHHDKAR